MPLTPEELETELAANPDLFTGLLEKKQSDIEKHFTGKGFVFKGKADYDKEIQTEAEKKTQKAIDDEAAKLYGSADKLAQMITGKTKPDGMRTKVWIEQLKADGLWPETEEQLKEIIKKHGGSSGGKDNAYKEELEKFRKEQLEKDQKAALKRVSDIVRSDFRNANVPVDATIKDESAKFNAIKDARNDLFDLFQTKYVGTEDEDGNIFFYKKNDADKTPLIDTKEDRYLTPLEIIKQNHKFLLAVEGHQQAGGGSKGQGGSGGSSPMTLDGIYRAAAKEGLAYLSPDWKKYVDEQKKLANLK